MANEVEIAVVGRDDQSRKRVFDTAERDAKRLGVSLNRVREIAQGVLARDLIKEIGQRAQQFLGQAAAAASGLEQAVGGTRAVFGEAAEVVDGFGKTAARSVGLSEREFREATTSIGGQLKRMTGDVDLAAGKSIELVQVGADLAATYGGTTREAVDAFSAALRGEADPAERFNLNLKIGAQNAKAVELGLARTTAEVDDNARAQALLALIMEQSSDAQGQFAREAGTAAVAGQKASAAWEDAQAQLGQTLLPMLARGAEAVSTLAEGFSELPDSAQGTISAIALLGAGLLIVVPRLVAARTALIEFGVSARFANRSLGLIGVALGVATAAMLAFGQSNQEATPEVDSFSSSLDRQTGAITENTRQLVIQRLEQEGALRAAQELGVATGDVVDAVLGERAARDRVFDAIQREGAAIEKGTEARAEHLRLLQKVSDGIHLTEDELARARAAWQREQEAIEGSTEVAEQHVGVLDKLASQTGNTAEEITDKWQESSSQFVDAIGAMNEASKDLREDQKLTKEMLIEQLREQVEAQQNWHDNMVELARKVPPEIFDELARLGPEGADLVALLSKMSDKELQEYIDLMRSRGRTAGGELISEVQANFIEGADKLRAIAEQQGKKVAERIARGMRKNGTTVEEEARRQGLRIREGLGGPIFVDVIPRVAPTQGYLPGQYNAAGGLVGGLATGGVAGAERGMQHGGIAGSMVFGGGADAMVGEQGPEIVELPYGTRVIPSGQSRAMLRAANEALARLRSGGQFFEDFSYRGYSSNLGQFNDFFAEWYASGGGQLNRSQMIDFLSQLVDGLSTPQAGGGRQAMRQPLAAAPATSGQERFVLEVLVRRGFEGRLTDAIMDMLEFRLRTGIDVPEAIREVVLR